MTLVVYGIRNCDTMKRARAWLQSRGIAHDFHDYKVAGIDAATLHRWVDEAGWERLVNRSGTTFRKLPESQRADLDEARALQLMQAQPSLIRRPVLEGAGALLIGFDEASWAARFARR